jgi:hypothetical protein
MSRASTSQSSSSSGTILESRRIYARVESCSVAWCRLSVSSCVRACRCSALGWMPNRPPDPTMRRVWNVSVLTCMRHFCKAWIIRLDFPSPLMVVSGRLVLMFRQISCCALYPGRLTCSCNTKNRLKSASELGASSMLRKLGPVLPSAG